MVDSERTREVSLHRGTPESTLLHQCGMEDGLGHRARSKDFVMDVAKKWASILSRLTHSKSSIDQAACFALLQPQKASELLAAIVARMQGPDCFDCQHTDRGNVMMFR